MAAHFYCYFITYATYWVLIEGVGTIGGWDFSDLSILYGLSLLSYSISGTLIWYTVYHMDSMITDGNLDMYLTRPMGVMRQMIFQRFGDTFLGQIAVTLIFLITALVQKAEILSIWHYVYLVFSVIGGVLIQCGGMIFIGAISFWTKRSGAIGSIVFYDLRSLTQYPLALFPR